MKKIRHWLIGLVLALAAAVATAEGGHHHGRVLADDCVDGRHPVISFVIVPSVDISAQQPQPLMLQAKLKLPVRYSRRDHCFKPADQVGAVVILHGSGGIDARGDFYARALNDAGLATLEVDMWGARGVEGIANRPPLPLFNYPDAFAALAFLSQHSAIDPARIGVMGFSWGAVVSLAAAEQAYAAQFGQGLQFAAHVSNYPTCYGANNTAIPALVPNLQKGAQFLYPTGAPILIQIGTEDDYDNGADHCLALAEMINSTYGEIMKVNVYEGAAHAFDRLLPPVSVLDAFGDEGSVFSTGVVPTVDIVPDVDAAYLSRDRVVRFFRKALALGD